MRDLPKGIRVNHGYVEVRIFPDGKQYSRTFGKDTPLARQLATIHLNEKRKEIFMGTFNVSKVGRILVSDALDLFFDKHFKNYQHPETNEARSKESCTNTKSIIRLLKSFFEKYFVDELDVKALKEYRQQRIEFDDLANGTVNRELVILGSMINCFRLWVESDEVKPVRLPADKSGAAVNPCEVLPKLTERPRKRVASATELAALYRACFALGDAAMWSIIETELDTTLRYSDLMKLETVEVVNNQITVRQGKTGNDVNLPGIVKPVWSKVFINFRSRWEAVRDKAGCPDLQFRDIRKTGMQMLEQLGFSAEDIALTAGHSSKAITQKWYLAGTANAKKALPLVEARRALIEEIKVSAVTV